MLSERLLFRLSEPFVEWERVEVPREFDLAVGAARSIVDGDRVYLDYPQASACYRLEADAWERWSGAGKFRLNGCSNVREGRVVSYDKNRPVRAPRGGPGQPVHMMEVATGTLRELPPPPTRIAESAKRPCLTDNHVLVVGGVDGEPRRVLVLDLVKEKWSSYLAPQVPTFSYVLGARIFCEAGRRLFEVTPEGPGAMIDLPFKNYGACAAYDRIFFLDWPDRRMWELDAFSAFGSASASKPLLEERADDDAVVRLEAGLLSGGGSCRVTVRHIDGRRRSEAVDAAVAAVSSVAHPDEPGCEFASWVSTPVTDGDETSFTVDLADIDAYPEVAREIAHLLAGIAKSAGAAIMAS